MFESKQSNRRVQELLDDGNWNCHRASWSASSQSAIVADMPRGMVYGLYTRDDGVTDYARLVDADQFNDPNRGWRVVGSTVVPMFPILAHPREVRGSSPFTGRRGRTIVARADAPLWTGAANTFQTETNDPTTPNDTIEVTFRKGERFRKPR